MMIQITAAATDKTKAFSRDYTSEQAVKLATTAIATLNNMEETGAGLLALKFIAEVEAGTDKTMKNTANGNSLSFRRI